MDRDDDRAGVHRRRAVAFLAAAPLGSRVVVRALDGTGARDALGELVARTDTSCTVRTRREDLRIALTDVVAAKPVPPPPAPRPRRGVS
ncbi:hypothetical protein [Curtobacterium sp. RRHDQ10]|uniref:hypothetical protein n=1 Tax=Curtobacterium phyllosphaerae TaxID=3413379 RepID=UPI003BF36C5C